MTPNAVARLRTPGEIAGAIPLLTGFVPAESVVAVALCGQSRRVGLTVRFDLPPPAGTAVLVEELLLRMAAAEASAVVLAVYTDRPDEYDGLVTALLDRCDVPVPEALLVRDGRWWSYLCGEDACCPRAGTPVDVAATPALRIASAESALRGRAVLGSREELVRSVGPPRAAAAARRRLASAAGRPPSREVARARAGALLAAVADGREVTPSAAAGLAVALGDVGLRDEVATWALDRADALIALLIQVVRQVVPPYDAPVCTLLAWVAYATGDGGLANVALDRAHASDPDYRMANLLRCALDGQLPPPQIRDMLRRSRDSAQA